MSKFSAEVMIAIKQLLIGGIASFVHYLYLIAIKKEVFSVIQMLLNILIGSFCGWLTGQFIDDSTPYHNGVIAIAGITCFQLIELIEKKPKQIFDIINKVKK